MHMTYPIDDNKRVWIHVLFEFGDICPAVAMDDWRVIKELRDVYAYNDIQRGILNKHTELLKEYIADTSSVSINEDEFDVDTAKAYWIEHLRNKSIKND